MEAPKAPQLSAYDFLGYIVPGLAFILLVDISHLYHTSGISPTYEVLCKRYGSVSWAGLVPLLLLAYFIGHMISFISSMTIERHAGWMHGKPSTILLHSVRPEYLDTRPSHNEKASKILRLIIFTFMLPVATVEITAGKWLGLSKNYIRPADRLIKSAFNRAMSRLLAAIGVKLTDINKAHPSEYEIERIAIHCALERAPAHVYTLRNYVVLFGFMRAMCLICILSFWCVIAHAGLTKGYSAAALLFISLAPLVFIPYAAYLKFLFRFYYEAIMAIIAASASTKNST